MILFMWDKWNNSDRDTWVVSRAERVSEGNIVTFFPPEFMSHFGKRSVGRRLKACPMLYTV